MIFWIKSEKSLIYNDKLTPKFHLKIINLLKKFASPHGFNRMNKKLNLSVTLLSLGI